MGKMRSLFFVVLLHARHMRAHTHHETRGGDVPWLARPHGKCQVGIWRCARPVASKAQRSPTFASIWQASCSPVDRSRGWATAGLPAITPLRETLLTACTSIDTGTGACGYLKVLVTLSHDAGLCLCSEQQPKRAETKARGSYLM